MLFLNMKRTLNNSKEVKVIKLFTITRFSSIINLRQALYYYIVVVVDIRHFYIYKSQLVIL